MQRCADPSGRLWGHPGGTSRSASPPAPKASPLVTPPSPPPAPPPPRPSPAATFGGYITRAGVTCSLSVLHSPARGAGAKDGVIMGGLCPPHPLSPSPHISPPRFHGLSAFLSSARPFPLPPQGPLPKRKDIRLHPAALASSAQPGVTTIPTPERGGLPHPPTSRVICVPAAANTVKATGYLQVKSSKLTRSLQRNAVVFWLKTLLLPAPHCPSPTTGLETSGQPHML